MARMISVVSYAVLTVSLVLGLVTAAPAGDRRDRSPEDRKQRELEQFSRRMARVSPPSAQSPDEGFLHERARELIERVRQAPAGSYLLNRLEEATDDLGHGVAQLGREQRPAEIRQ